MFLWRTTSHITADISRSGGTRSASEDRGTLNSSKQRSDPSQTKLKGTMTAECLCALGLHFSVFVSRGAVSAPQLMESKSACPHQNSICLYSQIQQYLIAVLWSTLWCVSSRVKHSSIVCVSSHQTVHCTHRLLQPRALLGSSCRCVVLSSTG